MKRFFGFLLCLLPLLPLCGCWNRREISDLGIVMGFAVDCTDNQEEIEVTTQIAQTNAPLGETDKGSTGEDYLNVCTKGTDIFPCMRDSASKYGAKFYMAHNFVAIFGEDTAQRGISPYMDYILRNNDLRLNMQLLVAKGRGADILHTDSGPQTVPALQIRDLLLVQQQTSTGVSVRVFDYMNRFVSRRGAPLLPIIEIDTEGDEDRLCLNGTAVFDGDRMIGALSKEETRGYLWGTGAATFGVLTVYTDDDRADIEILKASGGITPVLDADGHISMVIHADVTGAIGGTQQNKSYIDKTDVDALLKAFSAQIEKEIHACLDRSYALHADIFGFSDVLYKKYPARWHDMQSDDFCFIPVRMEIKTQLVSAGRTVNLQIR